MLAKQSKRRVWSLVLAASVVALVTLACGESTPESAPSATEPPAAQPTEAPAEQRTEAPPEPTDTPEPTATPEPVYTDPVVLLEVSGTGEMVSDNYKLPACQKAIFYWTASPTSFGSASLILNLHSPAGEEKTLVNEFGMNVPAEGLGGSALQPLEGGEYYFSTENTDEPWSLRVECQDNVASIGAEINLQAQGNTVTDNYELPACQKSVFVWSAEPDENGSASLILQLCKVGEKRCVSIVNEFEMDLSEALTGETLESLKGGIYYLVSENTSGRPWSVRWECRD